MTSIQRLTPCHKKHRALKPSSQRMSAPGVETVTVSRTTAMVGETVAMYAEFQPEK